MERQGRHRDEEVRAEICTGGRTAAQIPRFRPGRHRRRRRSAIERAPPSRLEFRRLPDADALTMAWRRECRRNARPCDAGTTSMHLHAADAVRGLWVDRTRLTSPQAIDAAVASAVKDGFNTLIVQVRGR